MRRNNVARGCRAGRVADRGGRIVPTSRVVGGGIGGTGPHASHAAFSLKLLSGMRGKRDLNAEPSIHYRLGPLPQHVLHA